LKKLIKLIKEDTNYMAPNSNFNIGAGLGGKTGSNFHEEGWFGGDFFVEPGDEFVVKGNIAIKLEGKTNIIKKGDIIKVVATKDDAAFTIEWNKGKYKIGKKEFYSMSNKLQNKE
jgi:hypothetical protein